MNEVGPITDLVSQRIQSLLIFTLLMEQGDQQGLVAEALFQESLEQR